MNTDEKPAYLKSTLKLQVLKGSKEGRFLVQIVTPSGTVTESEIRMGDFLSLTVNAKIAQLEWE